MTRTRRSLDDLKKIATRLGGLCLARSFTRLDKRLKWKCKVGHCWTATARSVVRGNWCPRCSGRVVHTVLSLKKLAKLRGGKFLSPNFIGASKKHLWRCREGHEWYANVSSISKGSWCRTCYYKNNGLAQRSKIEDISKLARSKGGKLISQSYLNANDKLTWICKEGHKWNSSAHAIKRGSWCPNCARILVGKKNAHSIKYIKSIARNFGGELLSKVYISSRQFYKWKCKNGHTFSAKASNVLAGHWCPECSTRQRVTIERLRQYAKLKRGTIQFKSVRNAIEKLIWICADGHTFEASWNSIKNGSWCPECSSGLSERLVRAHFEFLFKQQFQKTRPKWLLNADGNRMEFDGFNPKLGLAFEHHGVQHYSGNNRFIKTKEDLRKRQRDDRQKRLLCKKHNIVLIEIPALGVFTKPDKLKDFIVNALLKAKVKLPLRATATPPDLRRASVKRELVQIRKIAQKRGGKCLSEKYLGAIHKMEFDCGNESHKSFLLTPSKLRSGQWCKPCSIDKWQKKVRDRNFKKIQSIVKARKGKCLSPAFFGLKLKMEFSCGIRNHPNFAAAPASIFAGRWCRLCGIEARAASQRGTIEDVKMIALSKGGKCISTEYKNNHTALRWRCSKGHSWQTSAKEIRRGRWCPLCVKTRFR